MRTRLWILSLLLLTSLSGSRAKNHADDPVLQERGTAGILAALEKLPVYAHILQVTAHPDDESAGTLTWLSRKFHAQTALFCLTRGEGGQNILGSEKYEELGLVRTGELREACKYYGADLYFGTVLDFGFSKTAEETLSKWGHEETLGEMVRFIRLYRPDVILSRFQGTSADGHGHHQAAGILTKEAFQAAANPVRFPEHFKDGIQIWKPKKLYTSSMGGEFAAAAGPESAARWTVRIPVGDYDPVLGSSYRELASKGYSKHRSQGNGAAVSLPGRAYEYFKLAESNAGSKEKEETFFDSIDTSLNAVYLLADGEQESVPFLQQDLKEIHQAAESALNAFEPGHPEKSAAAVSNGIQLLNDSIKKVEGSSLSRPVRQVVLEALHEKLDDFHDAAHAVLGIRLLMRTGELTAIPGEKEPFNLYLYNQGPEAVAIRRIDFPSTNKGATFFAASSPAGRQLQGGTSSATSASFDVSHGADVTEPFWKLANVTDGRYSILKSENRFAPFGRPELSAQVRYEFLGNEIPIDAVATAQAGDPIRGSDFEDLQIVPALSVTLNPALAIVPTGQRALSREFKVAVLNNDKSGSKGNLRIDLPANWRAEPAEALFNLPRKGDTFTATFKVRIPAGTKPGNYAVEAVATSGAQEFRRGYHTISYPENWTRNFYSPARATIERFDVAIAPKLTVGYVPGAGDELPAALEQLGVAVQVLSASDLAFGDLSRFATIVTGIRAYNVNEALRANNRRLLSYVERGGTLIVQYVRPMERPARGNKGSPFIYGPYPMSVSDADRITVEDTPVKILDPSNLIFSKPNRITEADFQGWVQERGLYFMDSWDPHYTPLLSGNDPGEQPVKGGMLYARYGKGHYIYTGYAWFRQLPAGVPGAFRIFANMLSLRAQVR